MIKRSIFKKLWAEHELPQHSILLGARQVGKSTLMHQLEEAARKKGLKTTFFDLEQSGDLRQFAGSEDHIIELIKRSGDVIFIDEFHYLKNASKILKAIFDARLGIKVYASGSSSLAVHKHLKESLAGRFFKTMVFPLTPDELGTQFSPNRFLKWGGMPGLVAFDDPERFLEMLSNIVNTYITKDIKGLLKEENIRAFNNLMYCLAQNQSFVSVAANLSREVGLAETTVARYLDIMGQTYVLHAVESYSGNLANELKKSRKYFLFDVGIRNALLKDFQNVDQREDKGILIESSVMVLLKSVLKENMDLRFWRTKKGDEVDFVVVKNRVPYPIEVKSKPAKTTPEGLCKFLRAYPQAPEAFVLSEEKHTSKEVEGRKVHFRPWFEACKLEFLQKIS